MEETFSEKNASIPRIYSKSSKLIDLILPIVYLLACYGFVAGKIMMPFYFGVFIYYLALFGIILSLFRFFMILFSF
jgi:hypothetical protein